MSRFTGFSEKYFLKEKKSEIWAKYGKWCYRFTLNFSKELASTDCSMRFCRDQIFKVMWYNQFKFLVFGNIKKVFRFAFVQANIFFLKIKKDFRDCQQITCAMLYIFCPLSKKTPTSLFLMVNIKMDRVQTKIKWKIYAFFTLYFKFWRYFL